MGFLGILVGIIIMLLALWGGSYLLWLYPFGTWQNFPSFMTAMITFIGGLGISSYCFIELT